MSAAPTKRPGRPTLGKSVRFHVYTTPEEAQLIDAAAAALQMGRSEYLIRSGLNHASAAAYIGRPRRAVAVLTDAARKALAILDGKEGGDPRL